MVVVCVGESDEGRVDVYVGTVARAVWMLRVVVCGCCVAVCLEQANLKLDYSGSYYNCSKHRQHHHHSVSVNKQKHQEF